MTIPRWPVALLLSLVAVLGYSSLTTGRAQVLDDQILRGCDIPKSFGRLVTLTTSPAGGLAGQAVFEDGEGTVRWVALMFNATEMIVQRPTRTAQMPFPNLPVYECALGHVWKRH